MRRLVYSPKAFVFVKDQEGTIHDLTAYTTAGTVTRRVDQVSSAEVQLRNPKMIFTAHVGENGITRPLFAPMDPITIYLQRTRNHPVRVFTGFLDETPYLQLYPGVVTLKASCTLKRLLYTYFDPALPYTQTFLRTYGWTPLNNGTAVSSTAYDEFLQLDKGDSNATPQTKSKVDGSLGNLLYATLKHIGHWDTKDVYVEGLPETLFDRITALSHEFAKDNEETKNKFKELLQKLAGSGQYGSADGTTPVDVGTVNGIPKQFTPMYSAAAAKFGLGKEGWAYLAAIHKTETSFSTNLSTSSAGAQGPMQFMPGTWATYGVDADGSGKADIMNNKDAIYGAAKYLKAAGAPGNWHDAIFAYNHAEWYVDQITKDAKAFLAASDASISAPQPDGALPEPDQTTRSPTKGGTSKAGASSDGKWVYPLNKKATSVGTVADHMSRPLGNWQSDNAVDMMTPAGTKWVAVEDGKISETQGYGQSSGAGTVYGYRLHLEGKSGNTYFYQHGASNLAPRGSSVKKGEIIGEVGSFNNGIPTHLHFAAKPPTNPETVVSGADITTTGADATGSGGTTPGTTGDNIGSALGATFFGQIEWPSLAEQAEATLLGGEKSLMNDKPLLPFVQQLCNASLRHFQSLPDGRFYAFFPDYFGEFNAHPPYWEIDDIEVLDGSISLNDDSLVTHMYVVGDTVNPAGGGTPFYMRAMSTAGVVTVFNMFMADYVLNKKDRSKPTKKGNQKNSTDPGGMGILLDRKDVVSFLDRYGVRPLVEDMPFIRSPYYEMFLAYQKFLLAWSRQFSTPFSFTFMPELFPGGKVGFPKHGLQMYIEETSHSWDYESGFTTTASLSAPSVYRTNDNESAVNLLPPNMVEAIIDPVKLERPDPNAP